MFTTHGCHDNCLPANRRADAADVRADGPADQDVPPGKRETAQPEPAADQSGDGSRDAANVQSRGEAGRRAASGEGAQPEVHTELVFCFYFIIFYESFISLVIFIR